MEFKKVRVHLGNLPPDVSEDDLKKKLKKHASCIDVELKHRQDGSSFAFANLEDTPDNINKCFELVPAKQWRGYQVTVQLAKESFLQRLQKEREAQKPVTEVSNSSGNANPDIVQRFETFSNVWKDDPSAEKLTKKHFFKSKDQHQKDDCFSPSAKEEKYFAGRIYGRGSLDTVTQDSGSFREQKKNECVSSPDKRYNGINKEIQQKKSYNNFKEKSENKRLKSIEEKYETYVQKKQVVKSALANISDSNRPNKKIIFDEDDYSDDGQQIYQNTSDKKEKQEENRLLLFDEGDEGETEENRFEDFRIRSHFEGKKGQKLFELQARYGNDSRFRLNERFYDSDGEHADETVEPPDKQTQTQEEKNTMLQVLKNVLGDEPLHKGKSKSAAATIMKRFDPTIPDNITLEIKPDGIKQKKKKPFTNIDIEEIPLSVKDQSSNVNETLPNVSKERYYKVSETLKEVLGRKEKFSMLEMFREDGEEEEDEEKDAENDHKAQSIPQKVKWHLDPFKYDSSDEEEEKREGKEGESLVERGPAVKHETFFFLLGDHRYKEGMEFIRTKKREKLDSEKIKQIKTAVKHKVKLRQRDNFVAHFKRRRKTIKK